MAWFWTDDLARLLLDAGLADEPSLRDWLARPAAVAGPEEADPLVLARALAGLGEEVGAA